MVTPPDPDSLAAAAAAAAYPLAKVGAEAVKKTIVDPLADAIAQPIREFAAKHIGGAFRRVLRLEDAAQLALADTAAKLASTPPEQLVEPDPAIVAGAIEALQTRHEVPEVRELFAQLLASSMDGARADAAHPAFVEVIRQLSGDDARVFGAMARNEEYYFLLGRDDGPALTVEERSDQMRRAWRVLGEDAGVGDVMRVGHALTNLDRLGLVKRVEESVVGYGGVGRTPVKGAVVINAFGRRFARASLPAATPAPGAIDLGAGDIELEDPR